MLSVATAQPAGAGGVHFCGVGTMKNIAISLVVALSACASTALVASAAWADDQDQSAQGQSTQATQAQGQATQGKWTQDQPVRTMRNALPTPNATPTDDDTPIRPGANSAFARDRNTSVLERQHPEYQALGVQLGAFTAFPKLTETAVYDDNVFANSSGAVSDWTFETKPSLRVESNWSRNQLVGFASVTAYNYAELSHLNTTDYEVGANGRLDIAGASYIFADAENGRYTIPFTNLAVPREAVTPEQFTLSQGDIGSVQEFNRLRFSERFNAAGYTYGNLVDGLGDVIFEDTQNHATYTEQGRADYALSPDTAVFGLVNFNQRDYNNGGDQGVNSSGYEATVGASFDITKLVRGEVQVGYLEQDFTSAPTATPAIPSKTLTGPAFHGKVEWFPSELTTVTLAGDREVEDFTVAGASGTLGTGGSVQVDHELLRNLILSAKGTYNQYEFVGLGRTDTAWTGGVEANYLLNRHLGVDLAYRYMDQTSTVSNLNFKDNRLAVALTFQY